MDGTAERPSDLGLLLACRWLHSAGALCKDDLLRQLIMQPEIAPLRELLPCCGFLLTRDGDVEAVSVTPASCMPARCLAWDGAAEAALAAVHPLAFQHSLEGALSVTAAVTTRHAKRAAQLREPLPLSFLLPLMGGKVEALSVKLKTRPSSPLVAAVSATEPSVRGTKYSRAGWPSLVILLAAKATPKPTIYAACMHHYAA